MSDKDDPQGRPNKKPDDPKGGAYTVLVADNYRIPDESALLGESKFSSLEEAKAACRQIVDECLEKYHKPGMTSEDLLGYYCSGGEHPWIAGEPAGSRFDAREYARERCLEICREEDKALKYLRIDELPAELAALIPVIEVALQRKSLKEKEEKALHMLREQIARMPEPMPDQSFVLCHDSSIPKNPKTGERRHSFSVHLTPRGFHFHWHSDTFMQCNAPEHKDWRPHSCNWVDHVFWKVYFHGTGRLDRRVGTVSEMMEEMKKHFASEEVELIAYSNKGDRGIDWQEEPIQTADAHPMRSRAP
ncbi:MAG: hypothetical protein HY360_05920 [Verrucomicrobia bacterium]|nr:hypothetical protein [Verrucomicrobiota bacterium]